MPLSTDLTRARRAARFFHAHRGAAATIVLLTLAISGVNAFEPLVLKFVFDGLSGEAGRRTLVAGVVGLATLGVVREALAAIANALTWRTRLAVQHQLLDETVGRLHRLPVSFYRSEGVGAIMTRLDRGISGAVEAASQLAFQVLPSAVFLVVAILIMVRLDARLAAVVLVFAPLPAILAARAAPRQTHRERALLDRWTRIYSRFNEVLSGIVTVRSFTQEDEEKRRFIREVSAANRLVVDGVRYDARVLASQNLVATAGRVAALAVGGLLAIRGEITVGTLVAFLGYVGSLFGPVQGLTNSYKTLRTASVSLETVFSILDQQDALGDAPDAVELPRARGEIRFEGVSFRYGPDRPTLSGVDLEIAAGERFALVGPSGAGKSTLVALLQRFYDPTSGRVLLDGVDLRTVKQRSLRSQIGVVLQECLLFDDSVAANIAYGRPEATARSIEAAARAANAHAFIETLPDGYDTRVGERGARLSGGERQRIAIARALLKDPPVLVLDEATSSLDAESEELVQDALERLMRGRTTIVIAHRLVTVVRADRVCVLREGRVVELGPHAELLARGGYYASLVRSQTEPLLPESYWSATNRRRGERRRPVIGAGAPRHISDR